MSAAPVLPVDMSTKIGGRLVQPALPVVDSSLPTPLEINFNESLKVNFSQDNIPLESTEGIQRRERVLNRMGALCRDWIRSVCRKRGLPPDVVDSAGGQLFTSGSYRLGVHEPGADIDTILVAPNTCTRQEFFGTLSTDGGDPNDPNSSESAITDVKLRDPESLAERIRTHPDVTNFVPVEGAAVPILTFDWEGVNIDLLFARLNSASVPTDFDIDNDAVLDGVDSATEKSLNGPRVTNLIAALVATGDGAAERYQTFLAVVRCVRKWAKARGLYSNKMGYWGGVNINIAVALCVQLYPRTPPASLLRKFFLVFRTWRWPNPVMLTKPHDAGYGLQVWSSQSHTNARQVAPIITPAYPAMNSTLAVSRQTLQIMHEEFCRGHDILDRLWKQHQANTANGQPNEALDWSELFRPSDFFIAYPNYLSLCIVGPTQTDCQAWAGFVESRLRKLVSDLLGRSLPLSKIQLWPKKVEACIADRSALLSSGQRRNCLTYFVGFQVDKLRMRGRQLNVENPLSQFREWELSRFQPLTPGMDVLVKTFVCKHLPKICFEIYDGGKIVAMQRRRALRDADPKRQERKRLKKINELKAKMAEKLQKKRDAEEAAAAEAVKEEGGDDGDAAVKMEGDGDEEDGGDDDDQGETPRKRKRSDSGMSSQDGMGEVEGEEPKPKAVKIETEENDEGGDVDEAGDVDEVDLLQSALDTLGKTREEAESDRRKLLAGELLIEGADDAPSDDEDHLGYTGDGARQTFMVKPKASAGGADPDAITKRVHKDIRSLPMADDEVEMLEKAGYTVVSDGDEDSKIIGGNMPTPFRSVPNKNKSEQIKLKIEFRYRFDIVELDADGKIIDKGDEDFTPSKTWAGRMAGFEFKLGERGLGYYRTGKKVVVPSNTAY